MKRFLLTAASAVALGLAAPAAATAAEPAAQPMAWPTGCHDEVLNDHMTGAICTSSNGGAYQAIAICKDRSSGKVNFYYGPWRTSGTSYAYCQGNSYVDSSGISTSPTVP
ncbi:hypothetical protein [Amycolatopsis vancoresmycina]|uniref:hypothetical protein n=1 Tax=Amycolatopsis vancoresmycina TaxID=208444 RepID=UPI00196A0EC8|nr:hypothetical protein [Amycolatopsis vancoresmycina]